MMSSTIFAVKLPFRDDSASGFPPFNSSCEKIHGSETAEESLGCLRSSTVSHGLNETALHLWEMVEQL